MLPVLLCGEEWAALAFARIAALDSGVCVSLDALRSRGLPLAADANVHAMLSQIHRDEAMHVMASRCYACLLLEKRQAYAVGLSLTARDSAGEGLHRAGTRVS